MSIVTEINNLRKCLLCKLVYEGEVVAYRARTYNLEKRRFEFCDFYIDDIEDSEIRKLIDSDTLTNHKAQLILYNGNLVTEQEKTGEYIFRELENVKEKEELLKFIIHIQKQTENLNLSVDTNLYGDDMTKAEESVRKG